MATDLRISGASANPRSESDIRVDYNDPSKIIAASNAIGDSSQAQFFSSNGGATWGQTTLPLQPGDAFMSDPAVDWTSDGTAWAITLGINAAQTVIKMRAYKSSDSGATWTFDATPTGAATNIDKEMMWVDRSATSPHKDNIYVIYHFADPAFVVRRTGPTGSWQTPVQVSGAETSAEAIGGDIKTNAFGDVFAFWPDTVIDPTNVNPNPATAGKIWMAKSTNGGANFGTPVLVANTFDSYDIGIPAMSSRRALIYASAAAYRTATKNLVHATWTDQTGVAGCNAPANEPNTTVGSACKTRIWYARSTDGGATWSAPVMINNQASKNDQFNQKLALDEANGNLAVIYYDTVGDAGRLKTDVWMQTSTDDGQTWNTAVKVSSAQTDETTGGADSGNQYGDYNGLDGYYGTFFPSWTDRRGGGSEEIWTEALSVIRKTAYFIVDRSVFGQGEVDGMLLLSNPFIVQAAFYVVLEGFKASELGISASDLVGAPVTKPTLTSSPAVAGMTIGQPTALLAEDPTLPDMVQRFTWVYPISFTSSAGFPAVSETVTLNATMGGVSGNAQIELLHQPTPYENDGATSWLSTDLRVFKVKAGDTKFNATIGSTPAAASTFIKAVINNLNTNNTAGQTFDNDISTDENASALALYQFDASNTAVFNFAVAKVHYRSILDDAQQVRVFFRLFPALSVSTVYDTTTTYRRASDGVQFGHAIPLLGRVNGNILTIPCFADLRDGTVPMSAQHDDANVATPNIPHDATGHEVIHYFGCWLDINQPGQTWFPINPTTDGPYSGSLKSVLELVRNQHQCLVAEIAFDPYTIPGTESPGTSDKLAQRNLTLVLSANPGDVASRRIPSTFEIHPTTAQLEKIGQFDEVMIDWGNTPRGSTARIYLPEASADEILELAAKRYFGRKLTKVDDHTLQCPVGGVTYMPIPAGSNVNYTGLLTVDLPPGVRAGQHFKIVVRQVTLGGIVRQIPPQTPGLQAGGEIVGAAASNLSFSKRVLGTFQISIPVSTKAHMLVPEERLLSLMRYILESIPSHDRWYPVFHRYVGEIAERVKGLGGNPTLILPSPTGDGLHHRPHHGDHDHDHEGEHGHKPERGEEQHAFTGKVAGLVYDRFGDFEGFLLDTEDGERTFKSREREMEELAERAWRERLRLTVWVERDEPNRPLTIVLREPPVR